MWRLRLPALAAVVGPVAFLACFSASLRLPHAAGAGSAAASGAWPHAHVLLASAGLASLGLAALAGAFYLIEYRRLKARRVGPPRFPLPSLEALDRVNTVTLALGFPLLTLGVGTGMLWQQATTGRIWGGSLHETWTLVAWVIYAGLVGVRFVGHQGARQAAASALAGFLFLLFAVVGIGVVA